MSGLYPLSRQQQLDSNGKLLAGARLFLFTGGTTVPINGYKDAALTAPHTSPILSDAAGRFPLIYLADGFYRQRLTTKGGTLIFDDDGIPVISTGAGGAGTTVDPNGLFKTRDIKIRFDDQPLSGYVRLNGQTIGSATSGATERANADTQPLYEELWQFANIAVIGGKGGSAAGDYAANKPLVLPDAAGRGLFGKDDLGAGAKGRITAFSIAGPTVVGAAGGLESRLLTQGNLPSYNLSATVPGQFVPITVSGSANVTVTGTTDAQGDHTHTVSGTTAAMKAGQLHNHGVSGGTFGGTGVYSNFGNFGGLVAPQGGVGITISNANIDHVHDFGGGSSVNGVHSHGVSGSGSGTSAGTGTATVAAMPITVPSGGGASPFPIIPPALLLMIYIRL